MRQQVLSYAARECPNFPPLVSYFPTLARSSASSRSCSASRRACDWLQRKQVVSNRRPFRTNAARARCADQDQAAGTIRWESSRAGAS